MQRHWGVEEPALFELLQANTDGQEYVGSSQEEQVR